MEDKARFELISSYANYTNLLPTRATKNSAGYDFYVAEDMIIPAFTNQFNFLYKMNERPLTLTEISFLTKKFNCKPTLVPTGVKAYIPEGQYLQLSVRSSTPLKYWLVLANGVGIIDADYYNNPDNEGHIFFQIINLFPNDIQLNKDDKIGQGIFLSYYTAEGDLTAAARTGGFGSTEK